MWGGYDYGWGWGMGFGMISMVLFWALVILGIVILVKWIASGSSGPSQTPAKTALDILKERYARGEIDREEFEQEKRDLASRSNAANMRRQGTSVGGTATLFAPRVMVAIFAIMPLLAPAAAPPTRSAAEAKPRFASLQVEIWPEFDRRGEVLVILRGELAADLALPATVSLRIPASSGTTAVAFATAPNSQLFNLEHERTYSEAFITLRFKISQRFVHVEFYDRLAPDMPTRRFTHRYVWPGDLAVDRLSVLFQ